LARSAKKSFPHRIVNPGLCVRGPVRHACARHAQIVAEVCVPGWRLEAWQVVRWSSQPGISFPNIERFGYAARQADDHPQTGDDDRAGLFSGRRATTIIAKY